jgi:pimeloyl-ACP methyl ester carboxylesterase
MDHLNTKETPPEYLTRADGVRIAFRRVGSTQKSTAPTIVFLPGYMSDMEGSKALALEAWAIRHNRAMIRLDYSGCGESDGVFADSTFEIWRDDVLLAIEMLVRGPVLLVGSSMGGWLMLMVAQALGTQVAGMIGIAAAPDFTDWGFGPQEIATIERDGVLLSPNPYGPEPTPTYRALYRSGKALEMLDSEIALDCPVRLLQGQRDADVPWKIAIKLAKALRSSNVQLTLVKDGDHRLSRDTDIALLLETVARFPI